MWSIPFAALLIAPVVIGQQVDKQGHETYDGYKVFRVATEKNASEFEAQIQSLSAVDLSCDHGHHNEQHFDVAVPPESLDAFSALYHDAELLTEDLGENIALEGRLQPFFDSKVKVLGADDGPGDLPDLSWFDAYHPYADHMKYLETLQAAFPNNSELIEAGLSFEGRTIHGIHMWGARENGTQPAILYHGNVHAREWITSMTVEYIAYQLVNNFYNDTTLRGALDNFDFYIFPIVNPDGFIYTQTKNRMWRKNRQTRPGTSAVGTDINRNWPYKWDGPSSSDRPGSETYRGVSPGDTPENTGLREFGDRLVARHGIRLFIDWHSYGQDILTPYGYSCSAQAPNQGKQNNLAIGASNAIAKAHGVYFMSGPTCSSLYITTGTSNDYFTDVGKANYSWAIELRDTGRYGFTLPPNQILASGEESLEGQKYVWSHI